MIGQGHVAIGYLKELYLEIPSATECHLVLVVNRPRDLKAVDDLLRAAGTDLSKVCAVHP